MLASESTSRTPPPGGLMDVEAIRDASPIEVIIGEHVRLRRSGVQLVGLCPFHSEKTPSFTVHPVKGLFFCHGCGAGGDIFAFIGKLLHRGFREAAGYLAERAGIIFDEQADPEQNARAKRERETKRRTAEALADAEFSTWQETRDNLHRLLNLRREAARRLGAIRDGAPARWPSEPEVAWEILRTVADELGGADAAYCIASFAAPAERYGFALHPERRAGMIEAALERGYVAGGKGQRFEIPL